MHLIYNRLQPLIPDSRVIPSPPLLHLGQLRAVLCVCESEETMAVTPAGGRSVRPSSPNATAASLQSSVPTKAPRPPLQAASTCPSLLWGPTWNLRNVHLRRVWESATSPSLGMGAPSSLAGTPQTTPQLLLQGTARLPSPLQPLQGGGPSPSPGPAQLFRLFSSRALPTSPLPCGDSEEEDWVLPLDLLSFSASSPPGVSLPTYRLQELAHLNLVLLFQEFLNLAFILYWNLVDLQCCVSFCCIAKW